jgi:carbon monoxide dehydrogenase subunit G
MSLSYIADGLKAHDLAKLKSSLNMDYGQIVGQLASETIDSLARRAATEGNVVVYGDGSISARSSLDLGTAGHRLTADTFAYVNALTGHWAHGADSMFAVVDDFQYMDLLWTSGNKLIEKALYSKGSDDVLYNFEAGQLAGFRIVRSAWAKSFYGAGAANASAVSTTIAASATANIGGARTIEVAANTNIVAGMWLTVGTLQTSTESDATIITEPVQVASVSSTTITVNGRGPGGGLMYDHAVGATVKNSDTAHCAVFGSKESLIVEFGEYGRYGMTGAPFQDGNARQWTTYWLKYFGNYGRHDETKLVRVETSASKQ